MKPIGTTYMFGEKGHFHIYPGNVSRKCTVNHNQFKNFKEYAFLAVWTLILAVITFYQGTGGF
jgi:hypothetical protein